MPNDFFGQAVVVAKDVAARERLHAKLVKLLADEFPSVVSRVSPLELGPPVGWPIQYRVIGPELSQVRDIAFKLAEVMAADPLTRTVNYDWIEPAREIRIRVDQDQARLLGLSTEAIGTVLNTVVTGAPVTQVRDDIYLVDVVLRATDEQRVSLDTLRTVQVPLPGGRTVPLSQFASFDYEQTYPLVWRRDRLPALTVQSDIAEGELPETVVDQLKPKIEELAKTLPAGYRIETGGTVEESASSLASVMAVVPVMLLIMFTVLMFQLRRFSLTLLVISVAPLGLIGVVLALLVSNRPLGFVAILGVLALIGMIIKNAVILIGQIEAERAAGKDARTRGDGRLLRPLHPDHADRGLHRAGHDPDRPDGVLGADGLRHHGRAAGRDAADADLPAGALSGDRRPRARRRLVRRGGRRRPAASSGGGPMRSIM